MSGAPLIALMGVICVATLFIGLGFVFPVSSGVGDLFDSWQSHRVCFSLGYSMTDSQIVLW